jgi:hypothetical protein
MKRTATLAFVFVVMLSTTALGQNPRAVLAQGQPPLTQEMVDRLASVYETILEFRFTPAQRSRFRQGEIDYWVNHNAEGIKLSLDNLKYYGQTEQLAEMRNAKTQKRHHRIAPPRYRGDERSGVGRYRRGLRQCSS